jgi:hypothetical protein
MESDYLISGLLEEYKESDDEHKVKFVNEFINSIWKSNYTYKTYKRYYTFTVNEDLLHNRKDLIEMFNKYSIIEFTVCKSFYDKQLIPYDYIRIHINNMFGFLTDQNVYLPREYYQLLLSPKHEYFSIIEKLKQGIDVNCNEVEKSITSSLLQADEIKLAAIKKKLEMPWKDYKKLINSYIERLFNNFTPLHEYEEKHGWEMHVDVDGWSEDNYIVKYFCKSLTGYLRNYVRDSLVLEKTCISCGLKISKRKKYCEGCYKEHRKKYIRAKVNEHRKIRKCKQ